MTESEGKVAILSVDDRFSGQSLPYPVVQYQKLQTLLEEYDENIKLILFDLSQASPVDLEQISAIKNADVGEETPLVVLHGDSLRDQRLNAFKLGCDDFIDVTTDQDEIAVRCDKLIFNKIANEQLKERIQQANEMAFIAMSDTSDLGVNIQFLIDANQCNNLDELGMSLLQSVSNYGIKASLQLRSEFGIKNMEQNGMAKDLESALLWELREDGRYVDFGKRSVMNYEQVSLLVKNMPLDDEKKYGAIKDNVFSLLQGADARIKALDSLKQLEQQQNLMKAIAVKMKNMMGEIDEGYQSVMKDIADVVENMAEGTNEIITNLALNEEQELALENVMNSGIEATNQVFSEGLKMDESLKKVISEMDGLLAEGDGPITLEKRVKLLSLLDE